MSFASAALVAVLVVAGLVVLVVRALLATRGSLARAESIARRQRAWANEKSVYLTSRTRIADGVQAGTGAVQVGAGIVGTGHRLIAAIPFGILGAIPATRPGSARVRAAHDETADAVYDTIDTLSGRIGEAVRRRLVGEAGGLPPELEG